MTGPDRIWAERKTMPGDPAENGYWESRNLYALTMAEYVRRDPAVLAALPEVQALIAAARLDYRKLVAAISGNPSGTKCDSCRSCGMIHCADAFYDCSGMRDYTPAEATAALAARYRAMIARGMREAAGIAYRTCAETRHVTLGRQAEDAILARAEQIEKDAK